MRPESPHTTESYSHAASARAGIAPWLLASRPKTLTAAIVPILVGSGVVLVSHPVEGVRWWISLVAALSALAIQVGTNLLNDVMDFERGADTGDRLGPVRVTQSGMLTPREVYRGAALAYAVALVTGAVLVGVGGWPILLIGVLSLLFGYAYTGGPYPLAYRGLGDIFVLLFFGVIAVGGVVFLHTDHWPLSAIVAGIQVGAPAVVLLAVNNLRDIDTDTRAGKRTLAVRLGRRGTYHEIDLALALSLALGFFWMSRGEWLAAILPLITLPLARSISLGVRRAISGEDFNGMLARAALFHGLFGLLLAVGFFLR